MALGKRKDEGNFLPIAKFDARVGKLYLQDRMLTDSGWETKLRDVTSEFEAIFDLKNIQRGWARFPKGAAPELTLVPAGEDPGEAPTDEHKECVRVLFQMAAQLGGEVRELLSTSRGVWNGLDDLHDKYLADVNVHPEQQPIVKLARVKEIRVGAATIFVPVFEIIGWMPRPPDPKSQPPTTGSEPNEKTALAPSELDEKIPF